MTTKKRQIVIVAGPNGAGKTTFAANYLGDLRFVNADLLARGYDLSAGGGASAAAGREALREISELTKAGVNFAFETTLAGGWIARRIPEWRRRGYVVRLIFISLPNADIAVARVARRVLFGGHNVAEEVIRRRFASGLKNFYNIYKPMVCEWRHYDGGAARPVLIERGAN